MKKRILAILICTLLTASLFSPAVYAQEPARNTVNQSALQAKAKKITPTVTLSKTTYTWDGNAKRPSVTVKAGSTVLKKGRDYTLAYKNNKNVGKAKVIVTLKGKYTGKKAVSYKIRPKGTALSRVSKSTNAMTVKWKKQSAKMSKGRITGYQIQLATDKQFSEIRKSVKVKGYERTSKTFRELRKNTKYFVRIRTYKTIDGKNYYSSWSKAKSGKDTFTPEIVPSGLDLVLTENDEALLDKVAETQENTIISPVSVNLALSMLLEGAEGRTREELENYLCVQKDALDQYAGNLMQSTFDEVDADGNQKTTVQIANAFWYRPDIEVNDDYKDTLALRYGAEISDLDFGNGGIDAANIINTWCSEHTKGLIPRIVDADTVDGAANVLLNTLYFYDKWSSKFEQDCVYDGTFKGFTKNYDVSYMQSDETTAYENDYAVAFEKPYLNNYSFIGILPKATGEFNVADLDIPGLMANKLSGYDVISITMPKFSIESGGEITEFLKQLGLHDTFDEYSADFSGISKNTYVSDVIHKTKMIVDEEGTEAAAATAVVSKESSAFMDLNILEIKLNRPFAFMIIDRENSAVLFMGKICAPQ